MSVINYVCTLTSLLSEFTYSMIKYSFVINSITDITGDTRCISFLKPEGFSYASGQYLTLLLMINGKEVRRPYSISTVDTLDSEVMITVKRIENGEATRYLHEQIKVGDRLEGLAANGRFILSNPIPTQLLFIAAGSGISPIYALIRDVLYFSRSSVVLIYSNRSIDDTIFYASLTQLQSTFSQRFTIHWFFSNNKNLLQARLSRLRLEEIVEPYIHQSEFACYTCGPYLYMEMVTITMVTLGFSPNSIFKETFTLPEDEDDEDGSLINDENIPEFKDATVVLSINKNEYQFQVAAHQTVLQAALLQKIPLNYSCKNGMCSSCVVNLSQGEVYMHYNEVLTDKEVASGRILTCTAHPLNPVLHINVDEG